VRLTVTMAIACAAAARGDHRTAVAEGRKATELSTLLGCAHEAVRWGWAIATDSAFALGDLDAVDELLAWLDEFPVGYLADVQVVDRQRTRARLLAARRDPAATSALDAAVLEARKFGSPYHVALALLDEAEHLAAAGEVDRAVTLAAEAGVIGARLDCLPVQRRAAAVTGSPVSVTPVDTIASV
jgi:hypothetical protein